MQQGLRGVLIAGADDSGSKLFVQGFKRSGLSWVEQNALAAFASVLLRQPFAKHR